MANYDNHALITTKNQSSSQASKTSKIDGMRVKSKGMKLGNFCLKITILFRLPMKWITKY